MAEPKKKSALLMAFGAPEKDGKGEPEDGDGPDGYGEDGDDADFEQACEEFFVAAGIKPIDKKGACEALKSLIAMVDDEEEKEEGEGKEGEEEPEEPEAA